MPNSPTEQQKETLGIPKVVWLFGGLVGVILIVSAVLRLLTPAVPIQNNTWQKITPGFSTTDQVIKNLGEPTSTEAYGDGQKLNYPPAHKSVRSNEVIANKEGKVVFIREYVAYDEQHTLQEYSRRYGQPDLTIEPEGFGELTPGHVFLEQGVVIIAHVSDDTVFERWYFVPMNKEEFLREWSALLAPDVPDGPEYADPVEDVPESPAP